MTSATVEQRAVPRANRRRKIRRSRIGLHAFLIAATLLWMSPIVWAIFTAMRPYADTSQHGYVSWP